jgi:hypothetical protein
MRDAAGIDGVKRSREAASVVRFAGLVLIGGAICSPCNRENRPFRRRFGALATACSQSKATARRACAAIGETTDLLFFAFALTDNR